MVYGIEKFKEYFSDYTGQYVFIGGTACDILLDEIGASFRATKDLDVVLLIEALDGPFGAVFWKFIEDGGYEHKQKSTGREQFYRFSKPKVYNVPYRMDKKGFRNPLFRTSEFLKPLILDSWIFKTLHFGQMGFLTPIQAGIKIKLY